MVDAKFIDTPRKCILLSAGQQNEDCGKAVALSRADRTELNLQRAGKSVSRPRGRYSLSLLVMILLGLSGVVQAQTMSATPSADIHLGVATCAGGPCHGAASTTKKNGVLQNEYLTWQVHDKHAKAYTVLEGDLGKRIGKNLNIEPTKSNECLVCHADDVPEAQQGVQFKM